MANTKANGNQTGNVVSKTVTCPVVLKDGTNKNLVFVLDSITASIGAALNEVTEMFTVRLFGWKITVPALRAGNDNKDRMFTFLKGLTAAIFAECSEVTDTVKDEQKATVLHSLKKSGILKTDNFSKLAVNNAVTIWHNVKRAAVKNQIEREKQSFIAQITLTRVLNQDTKILRAENSQAAAKLETKYRKEFSLQAPATDK